MPGNKWSLGPPLLGPDRTVQGEGRGMTPPVPVELQTLKPLPHAKMCGPHPQGNNGLGQAQDSKTPRFCGDGAGGPPGPVRAYPLASSHVGGAEPRGPRRPLPKVRYNESCVCRQGAPAVPGRAAGPGAGASGAERHQGHPLAIGSEPEVETFQVKAAVQSWRLLVNEPSLLELEVEELLQGAGAAAVLAVRGVVLAAVGDDALQVGHEELAGDIIAAAQSLGHGLQVWGGGTLRAQL